MLDAVIVDDEKRQVVIIQVKNRRVVQLGAGRHYLQEDHAEVIGATVNQWLIDLGVRSSPKHKEAA